MRPCLSLVWCFVIVAATLSACNKVNKTSDSPIPSSSLTVGTSSPLSSDVPATDNGVPTAEKTKLFTDLDSTELPTKINLTIDGKKWSSTFIKMDLQRFGFFVPGSFQLFTFEDGSRIGINSAEFISLDRQNALRDKPFQDVELAKYKEYAGSALDENGVRHDAFAVQSNDGKDMFITFRYFEKNKGKVLPGFIEVASHMRFLKQRPAEDKAEEDVQRFLYLIKQKDNKGLLALLKESEFYSFLKLEDTGKIIEGFDKNLDLRSLRATLHYSGLSMSPGIGQFEYVFYDGKHPYPSIDTSALHDTMILTLRDDDQGKPVFHTPYIRYFPYAEKMVLQYIRLIKQGKVQQLAAFLNPDDLAVPDWVADKIIERYDDYFDLNLVTVRYVRDFTFEIVQKNKKSHTIRVSYGDGLMGISDDFQPEF